MKKPIIDLPSTKKDIPCSREDFIAAQIILDWGKKWDKTSETKKAPLINKNVDRILGIASNIAGKSNIQLGIPWTTEKILIALENSEKMVHRGLAWFVRQTVDGIICSAPSQRLLQATAEVQADIPWNKKVWTDYIIALARLKHRSMTMTELAEAQGITTAGATGSISRIERLWYVERIQRTDDKRVFDVRLTEKWRELIEKIEQFLSAK